MVERVSFSRTAEQFNRYADAGDKKRIEAGIMTESDVELIRAYVNSRIVESDNGKGLSDARQYKIRNSLSNICRFIKTPLLENSMADINAAVIAIKNGQKITAGNMNAGALSQNTKRDYIVFLKRLYLYAIEEGLCNLPADKIRRIKPPKAERITKTAEQMLTPDDVKKMIECCRGSMMIRDRAMLAVLFEAGIRINELGNLLWSDTKFEGNFVKINVCSKTGIPRYIPLTNATPYLSAWRSIYPDGEPTGDKPVFITKKTELENKGKKNETRNDVYRNLTYNYTRKHIALIGKRAGIEKKVSCHIWRHSRVTDMIKEGYPDSVIKMVCWGSLSSNMLANYGHLCNNDIDKAVAKINGLPIESETTKTDSFTTHICPACNHINSPTAKFCEVCGRRLSDKAEPVTLSDKEAIEEIHNDDYYKNEIAKMQADMNTMMQILQTVIPGAQLPFAAGENAATRTPVGKGLPAASQTTLNTHTQHPAEHPAEQA